MSTRCQSLSSMADSKSQQSSVLGSFLRTLSTKLKYQSEHCHFIALQCIFAVIVLHVHNATDRIIIIIKRQFIRRSNMASHHKGAVQCSQLVLWKQLVSEVGTRE